jgi:hypothetical protein
MANLTALLFAVTQLYTEHPGNNGVVRHCSA